MNIIWEKKTDYPIGIEDPTICTLYDNVVIICGFNAGLSNKFPHLRKTKIKKYTRGFKNDCYIFNVTEQKWKQLPNFPGKARQSLRSVNIDNNIFVWGGFCYDTNNELKNIPRIKWPNKTGWRVFKDGYLLQLNDNKFKWSTLPDLPYYASNPLILNRKHFIYLIFGATIFDHTRDAQPIVRDISKNLYNGDYLYCLDITNIENGWKKITKFPGTLRINATGCIFNDELIIIGGIYPNEKWNYRNNECRFFYVLDNWKFNLITETWHQISYNPYPVFHFPNSQVQNYDDKLILLNGKGFNNGKLLDNNKFVNFDDVNFIQHKNFSNQKSIIFYDITNDNYEILNTKLPLQIMNIPYIINKNKIYCCGGEHHIEQLYDGSWYGCHFDSFFVGTISDVVPETE